MPFDGNGVFNRSVSDYVFNTVISETDMNTEMDGMATGLSLCITKDGQQTVTANIPMNSNKFTGLANGSAIGDSVSLDQVQANAFAFQGTDSGAADAYIIALSPPTTTQAAGLRVSFVAANASTGPSTLNAGGGADAIEYQGAALAGGEIAAGATIVCEHDGTSWQMTSPSALTFINPMTTQGDIIRGGALGVAERLGAGTAGQALIHDATDALWGQVGTAGIADNAATLAKMASGTAGNIITYDAAGDPAAVATGTAGEILTSNGAGAAPTMQLGSVVQTQMTQTGAVATGTTTIPLDDTIPQITEGDEYMTVSITPKNTANKLFIEAGIYWGHSAGASARGILCVFQDAIANALAVSSTQVQNENQMTALSFENTAGTTSAITFRLRFGSNSAGTMTVNGLAGVRQLGGALNSFIRVTEYTV